MTKQQYDIIVDIKEQVKTSDSYSVFNRVIEKELALDLIKIADKAVYESSDVNPSDILAVFDLYVDDSMVQFKAVGRDVEYANHIVYLLTYDLYAVDEEQDGNDKYADVLFLEEV